MSSVVSANSLWFLHVRRQLHDLVFLIRWLDPSFRRLRADFGLCDVDLFVLPVRLLRVAAGVQAIEEAESPLQEIKERVGYDERLSPGGACGLYLFGPIPHQFHLLFPKSEYSAVLFPDFSPRFGFLWELTVGSIAAMVMPCFNEDVSLSVVRLLERRSEE